jgi:hypothetical protein
MREVVIQNATFGTGIGVVYLGICLASQKRMKLSYEMGMP